MARRPGRAAAGDFILGFGGRCLPSASIPSTERRSGDDSLHAIDDIDGNHS
jgi:hypothetical protein